MPEPKQKPRRCTNRDLIRDMAEFIRDLCQHHDRLKLAGQPIPARASREYERGIALLERMESGEE